jgi:choline dehydrogenase-like flavoprotein
LEAGSAYSILFGITHPTSRGRIRLAGRMRPTRRSSITYISKTEHHRTTFRVALRLAPAIGNVPPLKGWREREILPASADVDDFSVRAVITHNRPVGTCALGTVVDKDLRVAPIQNLFVVDSSVIPRITSGPVNAAIIAMAETWAREVLVRDHSLAARPEPAH